MSPKQRKTHKHLPQYVYFKHKAYYFAPKVKKGEKRRWHFLGKTLSEATEKWVKLVDRPTDIFTMNQLFDRYMTEVAPLKSTASYKANVIQIQPLRIWFGDMKPEEVTAVDIYKYLDKRSLKAKVGANREKSLLSHTYTMAIKWGIVKENPCRYVKRNTEKPRSRYIEDYEFLAVKSVASEKIQLLMDFAYITGQRIGDILDVKISDLTDEGIKIEQNKTGVRLLITWSEELERCVNAIRKLPRSRIYSFTLFCNKKGAPMSYTSFSTIWQKTMKKAIKEGLIEKSFTFHDIRAKAASDASDSKHASALLGHNNTYVTEKTYIRKHRKIVPLR